MENSVCFARHVAQYQICKTFLRADRDAVGSRASISTGIGSSAEDAAATCLAAAHAATPGLRQGSEVMRPATVAQLWQDYQATQVSLRLHTLTCSPRCCFLQGWQAHRERSFRLMEMTVCGDTMSPQSASSCMPRLTNICDACGTHRFLHKA